MFSHMNKKNLTSDQMEVQKGNKKRKLNEISQGEPHQDALTIDFLASTPTEEKQPVEDKKKAVAEIKECPFNPFGDDSCDMCGS